CRTATSRGSPRPTTPPSGNGTASACRPSARAACAGSTRAPAKTIRDYPAFIRCYDLLADGAEDLRPLPLAERRARLEAFVGRLDPSRFDLSPPVPFSDWTQLEQLRLVPPHPIIEGVMLKRLDSAYLAGRP